MLSLLPSMDADHIEVVVELAPLAQLCSNEHQLAASVVDTDRTLEDGLLHDVKVLSS